MGRGFSGKETEKGMGHKGLDVQGHFQDHIQGHFQGSQLLAVDITVDWLRKSPVLHEGLKDASSVPKKTTVSCE